MEVELNSLRVTIFALFSGLTLISLYAEHLRQELKKAKKQVSKMKFYIRSK